jgi:hypothetical protein
VASSAGAGGLPSYAQQAVTEDYWREHPNRAQVAPYTGRGPRRETANVVAAPPRPVWNDSGTAITGWEARDRPYAPSSYLSLNGRQLQSVRDAIDFEAGFDAPDSWIRNRWASAQAESRRLIQEEGMYVTPIELMTRYAMQMAGGGGSGGGGGGYGGYGGYGGGGGGGGGGPTTSINTNVTLTDPDTARTLLDQALSSYLGREATPQEQKKFLAALNEHEKASPTVTTSVTNAAGQVVTSSTSTQGGANSADFAKEFAQKKEGFSEYQAATTFLDAFMGALEAPETRIV